MKKKFAKSILLASIAVAISAPITAQAFSLNELKPEEPSVASEAITANKVPTEATNKKTTSSEDAVKAPTSADSQEPVDKLPISTSEVSKLDELTTSVNQGNLELQILTQEVERKKLETLLKEDSFQKRLESSLAAVSAQFSEKEKAYQEKIALLQSEIRRQKHLSADALEKAEIIKNEAEKTENSVFVTNVIGVGRNLTASVYYEDKIIKVREGMSLGNDLSVKEIAPNGVIFNDGDKEVFVALTNEEYAFSQTFNKQNLSIADSNSSNKQRINFKR
jgi:uncharacterized small protein (DUF1192 family)